MYVVMELMYNYGEFEGVTRVFGAYATREQAREVKGECDFRERERYMTVGSGVGDQFYYDVMELED